MESPVGRGRGGSTGSGTFKLLAWGMSSMIQYLAG